jgi:hypothetical protein
MPAKPQDPSIIWNIVEYRCLKDIFTKLYFIDQTHTPDPKNEWATSGISIDDICHQIKEYILAKHGNLHYPHIIISYTGRMQLFRPGNPDLGEPPAHFCYAGGGLTHQERITLETSAHLTSLGPVELYILEEESRYWNKSRKISEWLGSHASRGPIIADFLDKIKEYRKRRG